MILVSYSRQIWRTSVASVMVLLLSGCTVTNPGADKGLPLPDVAAMAPQAGPTAQITMEIHAVGEKPEFGQIQLNNGVTVQQTLEQAKLVKRFRRMNIQVMRPAGDQRAKLDVKYDHTKGSVNPLYDYVLHPGDHLIVAEDPASSLDDMFGSLASPLRRATGTRTSRR